MAVVAELTPEQWRAVMDLLNLRKPSSLPLNARITLRVEAPLERFDPSND